MIRAVSEKGSNEVCDEQREVSLVLGFEASVTAMNGCMIADAPEALAIILVRLVLGFLSPGLPESLLLGGKPSV